MSENIVKTSRQLQAEATKKTLLDVSLKLIKEQGFDNVKIEDICKEAGVSVGAFYHHIKNKAGIVVEGYSQCDEYFKDVVYPIFEERFDVDAILEYINHQMKYAEDFGTDLCIQIYRAQLTEGTEFFLSKERSLTKGLIELINRAQEKNVIKDEKDATVVANEILTISRGIIYNWCQNKGEYDIKEYGRELVSNYLKFYIK